MKIKDPIQFIYRMETVLDIYKRPYDSRFPVVCTDETTKQLIKEICKPMPMSPGHSERIDYEYERNGVGHLLMFFEPLGGYRRVFVDTSHTKKVWVSSIRDLMSTKYKEAEKVTLVMDNLAVHSAAAFYEFLPAEEARQLLRRLDFQYTPKHASWLNMAEIELAALSSQCLDRRIPDFASLHEQTAAWEKNRNKTAVKADWRFTAEDARIKLKKLYPTF